MANDTLLTIVGNTTAPVELRFTQSGAAVANWTVASTPRSFDKSKNEWVDGETLFMRCTAWREMAENAAESLCDKGVRVIVTGFLKARSYETREGEKRTVQELDVQEVAPSLKYATAKVTKANRGNGGQGGTARSQVDPYGGTNSGFTPAPASNGGQGDVWGGGSAGNWGTPANGEVPF